MAYPSRRPPSNGITAVLIPAFNALVHKVEISRMDSKGKDSWHLAFIYSGRNGLLHLMQKCGIRKGRNHSNKFGSCRKTLLKTPQAFDIDTGIRKLDHL